MSKIYTIRMQRYKYLNIWVRATTQFFYQTKIDEFINLWIMNHELLGFQGALRPSSILIKNFLFVYIVKQKQIKSSRILLKKKIRIYKI